MSNKRILILLFTSSIFIQYSIAQQSPVKEIIPDIESPVISGVDISFDEKWIVSCFRKVQIIDAETGQIVQEHNEHELVKKYPDTPVGIRSINLSNDNNLVVSGDNLFNIVVWDRTQNKRLNYFSSTNLDPSGGGIVGVAVLPDNKRVLSANGNGTMEMWDIETGELIKRYRNRGRILSIILLSDGKHVIYDSGTTVIVNLETDENIHAFTGSSPSISTDEKTLQIIGPNQTNDGGAILHYNLETFEKIREFTLEPSQFESNIDLSPDAKNFLIGNTVRQNGVTEILSRVLYDAVTPGAIRSYTARANAVANSPESEDQIIKYFPNGRKFLTVNGNVVHIWDISDVVTRILDAGIYDN